MIDVDNDDYNPSMITIEDKNDSIDIDKNLDVENKKSKRYYPLNLILYINTECHQIFITIHLYMPFL